MPFQTKLKSRDKKKLELSSMMESEVLEVKERYKSDNNNRRGSMSTYISSYPTDSIIKQSTKQTKEDTSDMVDRLKVTYHKQSIFDMHPENTYNSKSSQFLIPNEDHFKGDRCDDIRTQNISLGRNESITSSFSQMKGSHNLTQ